MSRSARYLPKRVPRKEQGTVVNGSELAEWERKPGVRIWAMDVLGGGRYRLHYTDDKRKETTQ